MNEPVLRVKHLNIAFQRKEGLFPVVKDLSFELLRHRILGLAGQSGAGKSLTVHGLSSLLPERSAVMTGEILFGETDLLKMEKRQRQSYSASHVSVILQDSINALNPYERIGFQMEETIRQHHGAKGGEKPLQTLSRFGIHEGEAVLRKYPHQLSGGMRQRIAIALALESGAGIVIADEPTTSVDAINQLKLMEFLKQLCLLRGLSMIYVSHNLNLIGTFCDDVLVMKDGRAVEQGTVRKVFSEPENGYTRELIKEAWLLSAQGRPWAGGLSRELAPATLKQAKPLLLVERLKKTYVSRTIKGRQAKLALKEMNFTLLEGETLGIVGESGCGKTTLARLLAGLLEADGGRILFNGEDLRNLNRKKARNLHSQIQLIFQNPFACLDPRMTIGDSLKEALGTGRKVAGQQQDQFIREALDECGLGGISLDRKPNEFSGGQLQRISITRALLCKPKLLIADEITSALDVSAQRQILELLKRLKDQLGLSQIFISHDLSVIREIADRILVLRDGAIEEEGTAQHIFSNPQKSYTKELLASMISFPALEFGEGEE